MLKKIAISFVLIVIVLFVSKDLILKIALERLLKEKLDLEVSLERTKLSWDSLNIEGLNFSDENFLITIADLKVLFDLSQIFNSQALKFLAPQTSIEINNQSVSFEGVFAANFLAQLKGGSLQELAGQLVNTGAGMINIKKETSLDRLKPYLDSDSHQALLKGFKNYSYSQGVVTLTKQADLLSISLKFNSPDSGKRNIIVNLHDIFH